MINSIFKFKNGKFIISEGYGSTKKLHEDTGEGSSLAKFLLEIIGDVDKCDAFLSKILEYCQSTSTNELNTDKIVDKIYSAKTNLYSDENLNNNIAAALMGQR